MTDLVITWPKSKPLQGYLDELARAVIQEEKAFYRLTMPPLSARGRCFHVHDGFVRGWLKILGHVQIVNNRQIANSAGTPPMVDSVTGGSFKDGWYLVRDPRWHPLVTPVPMKGFRGFQYVRPEMGLV